jgi:hypothetical protein
MNFSYVLVPTLDGQWGATNSNGTWTGMVRLLQTGEIDIGL